MVSKTAQGVERNRAQTAWWHAICQQSGVVFGLYMKAKTWSKCAVLLGLLAWIVPIGRAKVQTEAASQLFAVFGADYISPLISSPISLQKLNAELGSVAEFAGYDQLTLLAGDRSTPQFSMVTRYAGDLLGLLSAEFVLDGRKIVEGSRVFVAENYWREALKGDPNVLGRGIELGGEVYQIAGVVRAGCTALYDTDFWMPVSTRSAYGTMNSLRVIGALAQGKEWTSSEKLLAQLLHGGLKDEFFEQGKVRILPLDRKLVLYPSAPEQLAERPLQKFLQEPAA